MSRLASFLVRSVTPPLPSGLERQGFSHFTGTSLLEELLLKIKTPEAQKSALDSYPPRLLEPHLGKHWTRVAGLAPLTAQNAAVHLCAGVLEWRVAPSPESGESDGCCRVTERRQLGLLVSSAGKSPPHCRPSGLALRPG